MLTDAQLREYFEYLFGPDEPAPAIVDLSEGAVRPYPAPRYTAPRLMQYGRLAPNRPTLPTCGNCHGIGGACPECLGYGVTLHGNLDSPAEPGICPDCGSVGCPHCEETGKYDELPKE